MRRLIVVVSTMALTLLLAGGVALAATIHCPNDTSKGSPTTGLYCYGTAMADTMYGSDLHDFMFGKGGDDTLHGYGEIDTLQGGKGSDHIYGGAGADNSLWGGALGGGSYTDNSTDYVHGGRGGDTIIGGIARGGVDRLYGERGNDFIDASQRHQENFKPVTEEIIDCGAGAQDEVYFDKGVDVFTNRTNCEIRHAVP
jgi:Ca2+-binding RTX toxin-like protein